MNRAAISAAIFLGCALIVTGCSASGTTGSASESNQSISESPAESNAFPEISESPSQPNASPEPVDPGIVEAECFPRSYAEGEKVIRQQIKEFNLGRFKAAREYASVEFRKDVTLEDFRTIIEDGYPFLLESPEVSFIGCIERDEVLYLQVAFENQKVTVLTYRLVRDQDGLAIDAASITARSVNTEV